MCVCVNNLCNTHSPKPKTHTPQSQNNGGWITQLGCTQRCLGVSDTLSTFRFWACIVLYQTCCDFLISINLFTPFFQPWPPDFSSLGLRIQKTKPKFQAYVFELHYFVDTDHGFGLQGVSFQKESQFNWVLRKPPCSIIIFLYYFCDRHLLSLGRAKPEV